MVWVVTIPHKCSQVYTNSNVFKSKFGFLINIKLSLCLLVIYFVTQFVTFMKGGRVSELVQNFIISNCHNWGWEGGSASQFGQCHQIFRVFFLKASLISSKSDGWLQNIQISNGWQYSSKLSHICLYLIFPKTFI